jgi:signal transduction histidine kinase
MTSMTVQPVDAPMLAAARYRSALAEVPEVLELAAEACGTPMAALKVVGGGSAHFAATLGIRTRVDIPNSVSLCQIVSSDDRPMIVDDATRHPRLSTHPLVAGAEHVRFVGAAPLHHDGQIVGALCVFDDDARGRDPEATSRLLSRIARRVDAETGLRHVLTRQPFPVAVDNDDIVSAISHEIRTPLANIQGNLEMLTATPGAIAPGFARRIDAINRNANRLTRTVDSLLRAVNHQMEEPVSQPELIDLRSMVLTVPDARLRIAMPDSPVWINADPAMLQVAIGHLLTNALCFGGPESRIEVTLTAHPQPTLIIRDHGPGMPAGELLTAGTPFARGDLAILNQVPGLGLGLTITRRIVEAQGGMIDLDSVPGQGVTARIVLPHA